MPIGLRDVLIAFVVGGLLFAAGAAILGAATAGVIITGILGGFCSARLAFP